MKIEELDRRAERLRLVREALDAFAHAFEDFQAIEAEDSLDPTRLPRQKTALRNFVSNARSLQETLRTQVSRCVGRSAFDAWWADAGRAVRTDEVAQLFWGLRNPLDHEGVLVMTHRIAAVEPQEVIQQRVRDNEAANPDVGSWEIEIPLRFVTAIGDHPDNSAVVLMHHYLALMGQLYNDACVFALDHRQ